ncbi:hypothetical protein KEM55_004926, partial [Ascosphaera atra]
MADFPLDADRLFCGDSTLLHGKPTIMRTKAQMSLERDLQTLSANAGSNQQGPPAVAVTKPKEAKPRLLLMGLR